MITIVTMWAVFFCSSPGEIYCLRLFDVQEFQTKHECTAQIETAPLDPPHHFACLEVLRDGS
jgi:hypothetical protein